MIICFIFLFSSCIEDATSEPVLPFNATFQFFPNGVSGELDKVVWEGNTLKFSNSTERHIDWIKFKNLNISGIGRYDLLYSPAAEAYSLNNVYSTTVAPDQSNQEQGGYINISSYSEYYMSGSYHFTSWYYNSSLNRTVKVSVEGIFNNVPIN
jgi:hypothetical protein